MMPSYRTGFIAAAAFLGLSGAFCSPLSAQVVISENLDALTAGTLNGQAGWTASSNANYNISVVSGGLDYPGLSLDGGANHSIVAANSNTASKRVATHALASQTGELWMSIVVNRPSTAGSSFGVEFMLGNSAANLTGTNDFGGFSVGTGVFGGSGSLAQARAYLHPSNSSGAYNNSPTFSENANHLLLVRVSKTGSSGYYDTVDLWVDPTTSTDFVTGQTNANTPGGVTGLTTIDQFVITSYGPFSGGTGSTAWDSLVVAPSLEGLGIGLSMVPEPASAAWLVGCGALALTGFRRRRRA